MFFLEFFYMELVFMGTVAGVCLFIFSRLSKNADRAAEREHEIRKLQIQEQLHVSNPQLFAELDRLQRQFSLIAMGIRGGWIPFVMMFLHTMTQAKLTVDGKTYEQQPWVPPVVVVVALMVFYAFLFKRAFSITVKMKEAETQITIKTPKNEG